jgi:uncharacterized protein
MAQITNENLTESPCVGICSTSLGDEICMGCNRTFDEVRLWNSLPDAEKIKINQRLLSQAKDKITS